MADLQLAAGPLSLAGLDRGGGEDLVVFVAADERPLQGLGGLCDFRLCGALTRQLKSGLLEGRAGEAVLTVTGARLPVHRLFLFGAGPARTLDELAVAGLLTQAFAAVARAGGTRVATQAPGWGRLPPVHLARRILDAAVAARLASVRLLASDVAAARVALEAAAEDRAGVRVEPHATSERPRSAAAGRREAR
jgi:hypothetical protein